MDIIKPQDSLVAGALTAHVIAEGIHHSHLPAMILSLLVAGTGIYLAWQMYIKKGMDSKLISEKYKTPYLLSYNKFYIDEIYSRYLYTPVLKLADRIAYFDWDIYDKYFINGFGRVTDWLAKITGKVDYEGIDQGVVDSFGRNTRRAGKMLQSVQTGRLQTYMLFALMGVIVIMVIQVI